MSRFMREYTFDASVTIEAESEEQAADLIIEHCMTGIDIACILVKAGTLNVKDGEVKSIESVMTSPTTGER